MRKIKTILEKDLIIGRKYIYDCDSIIFTFLGREIDLSTYRMHLVLRSPENTIKKCPADDDDIWYDVNSFKFGR